MSVVIADQFRLWFVGRCLVVGLICAGFSFSSALAEFSGAIPDGLSIPAPSDDPDTVLPEASGETDASAWVVNPPRMLLIQSSTRPVRLVVDDAGQRADLSVNDMAHNVRVAARRYQSLFADLRVTVYNQERIFPIFSLYKPSTDACILGLNVRKDRWTRVTEKLVYFDRDDELEIFQELAAAHEIGHCLAAKYLEGLNRAWSSFQRELFADIVALMHVQEYMSDRRDEAFSQLVRFRAAPPIDDDRPNSDQLRRLFVAIDRAWPIESGNADVIGQRMEWALALMKSLDEPEPEPEPALVPATVPDPVSAPPETAPVEAAPLPADTAVE